MFILTPRERNVLLIVGSIVAVGAVLRHITLDRKVTDGPDNTSLIVSNGVKIVEKSSDTARSFPDYRININTASCDELVRLPGIGPQIAQRIVTYRSEHGGFLTLSDLEKVSGIGKKKIEKLQNRISF